MSGTNRPWYREPWPWLLMAGPVAVVIAGLITAWIAFHGNDGLVVDDYYKQGLAINQTLGRSDAAVRMGLRAELRLDAGRVSVVLGDGAVNGTPKLRLVHPTRSGMDQALDLVRVKPGVYEGQLQALLPGRWHVVLEDREWRLAGDWILPAEAPLLLGSRIAARAGEDKPREGGR